jgi:hypothetical protein
MADLHRLRLSLCPCLTDSGIIFPQKSKWIARGFISTRITWMNNDLNTNAPLISLLTAVCVPDLVLRWEELWVSPVFCGVWRLLLPTGTCGAASWLWHSH